jgi:hypothetical protein
MLKSSNLSFLSQNRSKTDIIERDAPPVKLKRCCKVNFGKGLGGHAALAVGLVDRAGRRV